LWFTQVLIIASKGSGILGPGQSVRLAPGAKIYDF
jgi:hypothetical protein